MQLIPQRHKPPIRCQIEVITRDGSNHRYCGLFTTTADAILDALDRFGFGVKVTARRAT